MRTISRSTRRHALAAAVCRGCIDAPAEAFELVVDAQRHSLRFINRPGHWDGNRWRHLNGGRLGHRLSCALFRFLRLETIPCCDANRGREDYCGAGDHATPR